LGDDTPEHTTDPGRDYVERHITSYGPLFAGLLEDGFEDLTQGNQLGSPMCSAGVRVQQFLGHGHRNLAVLLGSVKDELGGALQDLQGGHAGLE
jgi:hypothetical protein